MGLTGSLQNLGLVFFPMVIRFIFTETKSYTTTLLFFLFLMIVAIILSVLIIYEDRINDGVLHDVQTRDKREEMKVDVFDTESKFKSVSNEMNLGIVKHLLLRN